MARVEAPGVDACVDLHEAPGFGELPIEYALEEARAHCEAAGKRLCSEREWETACRGEAGYRFPYGDEFIPTACACGGVPVRSAGTSNSCRSAFGVYDLSGNAAEWVESGALKGGDHEGDAFDVRCGARAFPSDEEGPRMRGVRCCVDPG